MITQNELVKEIDVLLRIGKTDLEIINSLSAKYKIRRCDVSAIILCSSEIGKRSTDGSENWRKRGYYGYIERATREV